MHLLNFKVTFAVYVCHNYNSFHYVYNQCDSQLFHNFLFNLPEVETSTLKFMIATNLYKMCALASVFVQLNHHKTYQLGNEIVPLSYT